jgi:Diguanylate cyclase, GGDEF domain
VDVDKEETNPSVALASTRAVLRRFAAAAATIVASLGTLAAIKLSGATHEVQLPVWAVWVVIAFIVALIVVAAACVIFMYFETERVGDSISYWYIKANNLAVAVSDLEHKAYHDEVTGLRNTRALARELSTGANYDRCLILLDLRNFGSINKNHDHWKGDAYLRNFASMILSDSRRNEYIYKERPIANEDSETPASASGSAKEIATEIVKAFRRNDGGDEFYILLRGTVIDGFGYLNRLFEGSNEFDDMAERVLGAPHRFGFRAGMIALGREELFAEAAPRVAKCLGKTMGDASPSIVDWGRDQDDESTPIDYDDTNFPIGTPKGNILAKARKNFTRQIP